VTSRRTRTPAVESRRLARCDSTALGAFLGELPSVPAGDKAMHEAEESGARARSSNGSESVQSVKGRSCTGTMELANSAAKEG
jgi:hypothetical protein